MSPAIRATLKCPDCGLPRWSYYSQGTTRLHMLVCAHMTAAKPTKDETRQAWNVLATSAWHRKSTTSATDGTSDKPRLASPG